MNELSTIIVAADRRYTLANATQLALFTPSTQNTSHKLNFFHCLTKSSKTTFPLAVKLYSFGKQCADISRIYCTPILLNAKDFMPKFAIITTL